MHLLSHGLHDGFFDFTLDRAKRFRVRRMLLLPTVKISAVVGDGEFVTRHDVRQLSMVWTQWPNRSPGWNMPSDSKKASASSTLEKILVAVSVMNGEGFFFGFQTT